MAKSRLAFDIPGLKQLQDTQGLRIHLGLFDADGCLYNTAYLISLEFFITKNWMFFHAYDGKEKLRGGELQFVNNKIAELLNEIKAGEYSWQRALLKKTSTAIDLERAARIVKACQLQAGQSLMDFNVESAAKVREMIDKINIKALCRDFINYCVLRAYKLDPAVLGELLIANNQKLTDSILKAENLFDVFFLGVGSQRQSFQGNHFTMHYNSTGCIFHDLEYYANFLQTKLPGKKVINLRLLLADINNDLPLGESYTRILQAKFNNQNKIQHVIHEHDTNKFTILYAFIHFVADLFRKALITTRFFDNLETIHLFLFKTYASRPVLLPQSILCLQYYDGELKPEHVMAGTGDPDENFVANLQFMLQRYRIAYDKLSKELSHLDENVKDAKLEHYDIGTLVDMQELILRRRWQSIRRCASSENLLFHRPATKLKPSIKHGNSLRHSS